MSIPARSKWLKDAIQFSCTKCGKCCKGRTNVYMNASEASAIANHLNMTKFDFIKKYTEEKETVDGLLTSLKSTTNGASNSSCIFLKDNQCSIYHVRPTQCRTYPFWPHNLIGEAEWRSEAVTCEGIILPPLQDNHATVPETTILTNMVVNMVHNRGLGPDWTYDEAIEYLDETVRLAPDTINDFASEFFSTHHSEIQYESKSILVVDSTTPVLSNNSILGPHASDDDDDDDVDVDEDTAADERVKQMMDELTQPLSDEDKGELRAIQEKEIESEGEGETKTHTHRRMEFTALPRVTQSEVLLVPYSEHFKIGQPQYRVDHSVLSLPVHKAIADVFLSHYLVVQRDIDIYSQQHTDIEKEVVRIAILGAGGCVLPNHMLHVVKQNESVSPKLRIDAVEPDSEVLMVAEKYFDTHFDSESLIAHQTDGLSFLNRHIAKEGENTREAGNGTGGTSQAYDVIVIDALEVTTALLNESKDMHQQHSDRVSRAPPQSLLDGVHTVRQSLTHTAEGSTNSDRRKDGIVIINVFGDAEWLRKTMSTYNVHNGFQKPVVVVVGQSDSVNENNYLLITSPHYSNVDESNGSLLNDLVESMKCKGEDTYSFQEVDGGAVFVFNSAAL